MPWVCQNSSNRLPEKTSDSIPFCSKVARFQIPKFDEINQSCVAFFSQEDEEQVVIKNVKKCIMAKSNHVAATTARKKCQSKVADAAD